MPERLALARDTLLPASVLQEVAATYTGLAEKITGRPLPRSDDPRREILDILGAEFGLLA
jgi:phosphoribosylaminoimidazole-succinocarboxamide synthase